MFHEFVKSIFPPELNASHVSELICLTDPTVGQQWEEMVQGEGRQDCPKFIWFDTVLCAHSLLFLIIFPLPSLFPRCLHYLSIAAY